jgi:hypothetical protein
VTAPGGWTDAQLRRVGEAVELDLASYRPDGELGPFTTMWVVRVGDDLYVRSAGGPDRPWYRQALTSGAGRIRAGGVERDVAFDHDDAGVNGVHDAIDQAYHATYDRFGPGPVSHVTGRDAHAVTVRLVASLP